MCRRLTIAEVEHLVEPGEIDPDSIHTPGVYLHQAVPLSDSERNDKRIERRTVTLTHDTTHEEA